MQLPHNDFASSWRFSEIAPMFVIDPKNLLEVDFEDEKRDDETRKALAKELALKARIQSTWTRLNKDIVSIIADYSSPYAAAFSIGHMLTTRVYYNAKFCEIMIKLQIQHMAFVRAGPEKYHCPPRIYQFDMPEVKTLPLKQITWYLHDQPEIHPILKSGHDYTRYPIRSLPSGQYERTAEGPKRIKTIMDGSVPNSQVDGKYHTLELNPIVCHTSVQHHTVEIKNCFSPEQLASPLLKTDRIMSPSTIKDWKGKATWVIAYGHAA